MRSYYPSRINILLWLGIWGLILLVVGISTNLDFSISRIVASPISSIVWILILLFLAIICFGTGYNIKDEILLIKIGPMTERKIDIGEINSIERSYDLVASPANALKRLRINYQDRYVLISPAYEADFIRTLKKINPNVKVYNLEKTIKF